MEGFNFNENVYKIAAIIAFIILLATKSIRLCGALLIIVFIYFISKYNNNNS
jgi:hypothetical protein